MICRHCCRNKANRPRGLCWSCYYTPGVRERYPSTSRHANRGHGRDDDAGQQTPAAPTVHPPASDRKIEELAARAERGEALWHPQDADWGAWSEGTGGAAGEL